jgi:NAD kinase
MPGGEGIKTARHPQKKYSNLTFLKTTRNVEDFSCCPLMPFETQRLGFLFHEEHEGASVVWRVVCR